MVGPPVLTIWAESVTPRHQYVVRLALNLAGYEHAAISITAVKPISESEEGILLQYKTEYDKEAGGLHLHPSGLLEATGIQPVKNLNELAKDPLAALFWLAAHYTAYDPAHPKDDHGRPVRSILPGYDDPDQPVCHMLAHQFARLLGLKPIRKLIRIRHTVDIDNAYAFAAKGPWRWTGGLAKELLRTDFKAAGLRLRHALGKVDDPYDTHSVILQKWGGPDLAVFFLMSDKGKFDRAIPPSHPDFHRLVSQYAEAGCAIGLHPSYDGGQNPATVKAERELLQAMLPEKATLLSRVRYHFLRELTPHSQRLLLQRSFKEDYSPGPTKPGFWQGLTNSLSWYDVEQDEETNLSQYPACWMDATWAHDPVAGLQHLAQLKENLKPYGGTMILIWHNDYFKQFQEALTQFPGLLDDVDVN